MSLVTTQETLPDGQAQQAHPRTMGWIGTTALAMGGSNQSLFIMGALFAGQGDILGQGSAAVPLLTARLCRVPPSAACISCSKASR